MALTGYLRVVAAIVCSICWMLASSSLILANKHLLVNLNFPYPITIAAMGMLVTAVLSHMCISSRIVEPQVTMTWDLWLKRIFPIGFFHSLSLWSGNFVYLHLSVAFIQMLKAFTPIVVMLCLFVSRIEEPTKRVVFSVLLIALGTATTAYGELNLSAIGIFCMLFSQLMEAIRLVLTQVLLVGLKFHPIEGLYYTAPACSFWLVLGSIVFEVPVMIRNGSIGAIFEYKYLFLGCSLVGFVVNTFSYWTIKLASSLTLKVLANVKNTLLVFVGIIFLNEKVAPLQLMGYLVSLVGFVWYNYFTLREIAKQGDPDAAPSLPDPEKAKVEMTLG